MITATTGLEAAAIGGQSIYSFAGLSLSGFPSSPSIAAKARLSIAAKARIRETEILLWSELDYIGADVFDALDQLFRTARGKNVPFGGMQMILTGEFSGWAPLVTDRFHKPMAYESKVWNDLISTHVVKLDTVRRSIDDDERAAR